jgi:1-deoxy-D-xylulose-5-phosphate reductoisomerase
MAAMAAGGARPAVINAVNEEAVAAFLGKRLAFLDIAVIVARVMDRFDPPAPASLDDVFEIDRAARAHAGEAMERMAA